MPVSGLVVSLKSDPRLREEAIEAIGRESCIEVGVIERRKMAIVVDTDSSEDDKRIWCWLGALPGVAFVDVAMVAYDQPAERFDSSETLASATPPCNDFKLV